MEPGLQRPGTSHTLHGYRMRPENMYSVLEGGVMPKTYICGTCGDSCDCWTCGYSYDACKLIVDGDDRAPTLCPYLVGKRAYWHEVA